MNVDTGTVAALRRDPELAPLHPSLATYQDPGHAAALDQLYRRFVGPDDLAYDIGSHVGDRVASFRRLGARVVAVEPQPLCLRALRALYAGDPQVELVASVCADRPGTARMYVNSANPTVSTASPDFVAAAAGAPGWEGQEWDGQADVACTTLDELVAAYGVPAFTKIDVEGFEDAVLAGLTHRLPALSFEVTTIAREVALRCLDRLAALGPYRFNLALGDSPHLAFPGWISRADMAAHVRALPHAANAGDIYCVSS